MLRLLLVILALLATPAVTEQVSLTTRDNGVTVTGLLLSYDRGYFRIETEHGPVTLEAGSVVCEGAGCPANDQLVAGAVIVGPDGLLHRLAPSLIQGFAAHEGFDATRAFRDDTEEEWRLFDGDRLVAQIVLRPLIDADAIEAVDAGRADVAIVRSDTNPNLRNDVVALDAAVPIVAPDNPVASVSIGRVERILAGRDPSWSDGGPVQVHLLDDMRPVSAFDLADVTDGAVRHATSETLTDAVARDPGGFGLVPLSQIGNAVPLVVSGACGIASPATPSTIKSEDYPFVQPIFLTRKGVEQHRLIRDFVAFSLAPAAQPLVRASGFIDQAIGRVPFDRHGSRLAHAVMATQNESTGIAEIQRLVSTLFTGERLTIAFRFEDGDTTLDAPSLSNVRRLAQALRSGAFEDERLVFVGFSDSQGESDANLRLSARRADAVLDAVSVQARDAARGMSAEAFGELMPVACDNTPSERRINRRVEVWVLPE